MVCSIGRARVGQDNNVKRATENVEQRVALIRDGFPRSCAHLRDAQLYRSAFERRSTADTRYPNGLSTISLGGLQPVSWNFQHRIFELLSHTVAHSTERHVEAVWKKIGRAFTVHSTDSASQLMGSTVQLHGLLACFPRGWAAEAESSFEHWTALCSRVLKGAWNRLYNFVNHKFKQFCETFFCLIFTSFQT